jgi:hypothetical protein
MRTQPSHLVSALTVAIRLILEMIPLTVATEEATIPLTVVLSTLVMVLSTRETALMAIPMVESTLVKVLSTRETALMAIPMVESTRMAFAVQQTLVLSKANFKRHHISLRVTIAIHAEKEHAALINTVFVGQFGILLMAWKDVRKGTHSYHAHLIYT